MSRILIIISIAILLNSCLTDDDGVNHPDVPVLDAWIDSYGFPVALLTESLDPGSGAEISSKVIRWGKITISDGETTAIMTGSPDRNYFPPYRYHTSELYGVPGRTYTITAEFGGKKVTASAMMPEPTPIDNVTVSPIAGNDTLRSVSMTFTSPDDTPAYYYVTVRDLNSPSRVRALPAIMSTVKATRSGRPVEIPVFMPKVKHDTVTYTSNPTVGQRLELNLCRVSEEVFDFWDDYNSTILIGSSEFISGDISLRGNVNGGYGVFSPQGVSRMVVEVE